MSKLEFSNFRIALQLAGGFYRADTGFLGVFQGHQEQSTSEETQVEV